MTPIAPMKSSTLSSLSVLVETFLKYTPAFLPTIDSRIRGCSCAAGRAASTTPTIQRPASAPAARLTFQETFIFIYLRKSAILQCNTISDQAGLHAELAYTDVASDEQNRSGEHEHPGVLCDPLEPRRAQQKCTGNDDEQRGDDPKVETRRRLRAHRVEQHERRHNDSRCRNSGSQTRATPGQHCDKHRNQQCLNQEEPIGTDVEYRHPDLSGNSSGRCVLPDVVCVLGKEPSFLY